MIGQASNVLLGSKRNYLIVKDDVGKSKPSTRDLPENAFSYGRPDSIKLGVLVDRGHRQLPIKASYIGKNIPTSHDEHVHVFVNEIDKKDEVVLIKHNN